MPFIQQRLVRYFCDRLDVTGTVDIDKVLQSKAPLGRSGEGLADAFDVGGLLSVTGALYFDGQTAADRPCTVWLGATRTEFSGEAVAEQLWTYAGLSRVERHHKGLPFRLMHDGHPGARLVLRDDAMAAEILAHAPQLKGGFTIKGKGRTLAWTAGIAAGFILAGYLVLQFAPQHLAFFLPDSWRNRVGTQVELSLTEGATQCKSADGISAIGAMTARLAEGNPDLPPLAIQVYDIPVMNAFAMPGERIVITAELIRRANRPEQVAGVLAHEVGHVLKRHSEAQLVRATGLQILLSIMTGGGGDTISTIAGVAAILTYTREAEAEADDVGLALLERSAIDPMGLKEFFDIILAEEGKPSTGTWRKIESALSTHPGTEDRIKKIHPLPDDIAARPVMTDAQWQALKKICGSFNSSSGTGCFTEAPVCRRRRPAYRRRYACHQTLQRAPEPGCWQEGRHRVLQDGRRCSCLSARRTVHLRKRLSA